RLEEMEARIAELGRVAEAGAGRRTGIERGLEASRELLAEVERRIAAHDVELQQAEGSLARLRQDSAAAESRLNTLLELKRNFEGVSEGVKALLSGGETPPGVLGVVADVLEVPG